MGCTIGRTLDLTCKMPAGNSWINVIKNADKFKALVFNQTVSS